MKVIQLLPTISYGDAVGNDTVQLHNLFISWGYDTKIYAENIDSRINPDIVAHYSKLPKLNENDIILYHFSTGSDVMKEILEKQFCKKIMIYHNITPSQFFIPYSNVITGLVSSGRSDLKKMVNLFDCCIADSEFNKMDLIEAGYSCPIEVLPILVPFKDYDQKPNQDIIKEYSDDGWINILFVGRISPNKKQEDIIKIFNYYKKNLNNKSRLFIVGNYEGMELYYERLRKYASVLGLGEKDVIFTGHTSFDKILAYYSIADVFVCMSEHEGFCVPLLEAMKFNVPIIAYEAAAVPDTLGLAGIIVDTKDSVTVAYLIEGLVNDKVLCDIIIKGQLDKLEEYSYREVELKAKNIFNKFFSTNPAGIIENKLEIKNNQKNLYLVNFINNIKKRIKNNQSYDNSICFSEIEVKRVENKRRNYIKEIIKNRILRPGYRVISFISPSLSNCIRNEIYNISHVLQFGKVIGLDKLIIDKKPLKRKIPGVLVDVTEITNKDDKTGIQRVVNSTFNGLNTLDSNVLAVRAFDKKLITSQKYMSYCYNENYNNTEKLVDFIEGDKLLLLDSSWFYYKDYASIIRSSKSKNVGIYTVVYDLFPIQYPTLFPSRGFVNGFISWHQMILMNSDAILCISKATADVLIKYYKTTKIKRKEPLNIYVFHMGHNIIAREEQNIRKSIKLFLQEKPTFLMLGTVEPRKGHIYVLEAIEKVLEKDEDIQMLIIGKNGWNNDSVLKKIAKSKALENKVMWVQDANDEEVHWSFKNSRALIMASQDEGYGLPIIEAAHFGLPIICSDIPIFHEVAEDNATYFKCKDSNDLAQTLIIWLNEKKHPNSKKIKQYTWEESAQEVLDIMNGQTNPYKILN